MRQQCLLRLLSVDASGHVWNLTAISENYSQIKEADKRNVKKVRHVKKHDSGVNL